MSDDPITRNWPAWVTDLDDLIKRAERQHSDMRCCCSVDDDCYIGLLLDEVERLRVLSDSDRAAAAIVSFLAADDERCVNQDEEPNERWLIAYSKLREIAAVAARRAVQEATDG